MSLPALLSENKKQLRGTLARGWQKLRSFSPGPVETGRPICQLFIGGQGKQTVYTLINFPSLFAPSTASACNYDLVLYDSQGALVAKRRVTVPALGALEIRPQDIFGVSLPEIGLLSAQIAAGSRLSFANRHLGPIRAHFYALYHDLDMRSMAIVHPQSILWAEKSEAEPWQSNLIVCPRKLKEIELYQINPCPVETQTDLKVCSLDGSELSSSAARMPARGARRVSWKAADFVAHQHVVIASSGLAAPNAKPLLFQYHGAGFTASHA